MKMFLHFAKCAALGMVVVLLAGIHCAAQDAKGASQALVAGSEADHDALRALVPKYEEAANQGKPELLKPYLDPDFTGVMVTGDEVSTPATLDAYWAKIQKLLGEGGKYHVKVNVADRSIISGDLAVAHGTTADVVTARGKEYRFEGRWTAVCRKRDGQWKVLRIQGSMDPVLNPFVTAAISGASMTAGAVAGIVGLVVGWLLHFVLCRRKAAARA